MTQRMSVGGVARWRAMRLPEQPADQLELIQRLRECVGYTQWYVPMLGVMVASLHEEMLEANISPEERNIRYHKYMLARSLVRMVDNQEAALTRLIKK